MQDLVARKVLAVPPVLGKNNPADVRTKIHPAAHLNHLKELFNIKKILDVAAEANPAQGNLSRGMSRVGAIRSQAPSTSTITKIVTLVLAQLATSGSSTSEISVFASDNQCKVQPHNPRLIGVDDKWFYLFLLVGTMSII